MVVLFSHPVGGYTVSNYPFIVRWWWDWRLCWSIRLTRRGFWRLFGTGPWCHRYESIWQSSSRSIYIYIYVILKYTNMHIQSYLYLYIYIIHIYIYYTYIYIIHIYIYIYIIHKYIYIYENMNLDMTIPLQPWNIPTYRYFQMLFPCFRPCLCITDPPPTSPSITRRI